jgi:hypothetical protein
MTNLRKSLEMAIFYALTIVVLVILVVLMRFIVISA